MLLPSIILFLLVSYAVSFVYGYLTYVPQYSSTATLYVLKQKTENTANRQDYEDFTLELKVINDYEHLLKSHNVLDKVIDDLDLDLSYSDLRESISVINPEGSRILEVTVEADTPENAKRIVDTVCGVGVTKITEAMGSMQVSLIEYGIINSKPCNERFDLIQWVVNLF